MIVTLVFFIISTAELVLSENKLKNDIHDFINALGSNQSLQKLGKFRNKFSNYFHAILKLNNCCRYWWKFNG